MIEEFPTSLEHDYDQATQTATHKWVGKISIDLSAVVAIEPSVDVPTGVRIYLGSGDDRAARLVEADYDRLVQRWTIARKPKP